MHKETIVVHADPKNRLKKGGIVTPIYPATSYEYIDMDANRYPRYFNTPNQEVVLEKLCKLEQAEAGVLFSSGMAAISTTLRALLAPGDHVVLQEGIYGGSYSFMTEEFDELGIAYTFAAGTPASIQAAIQEHTKVIYVESPTNPLLDVVDLQEIARSARSQNILTIIDNTFASPINQNPIALGIDVVVHSGTKYLGGHSDLCTGVALTSKSLADKIQHKARHYGGSLNAIDCYLLERSLKTLHVRVERQTKNAGSLATYLEKHELVKRVFYPGLASHPGHEVAAKQMDGFGAMLAFELQQGIPVGKFLAALKVITPAMSLGGVESTICDPASTSHATMTAAARGAMGITDGMLRLSVGIEHTEDLLADLNQALESVSQLVSVAG